MRVEEPDAVLTEVGCDVTCQRHDQHARIQQRVVRVRGDAFPHRHHRRQRRRRVKPAPRDTKEDQQAERQSDRLVEVHVPGPRRCAPRNLVQGPTEQDLSNDSHGKQPVKRDRSSRIARHVAESAATASCRSHCLGPNRAASSEPLVALPALYECAPAPASFPLSTMRYSLRIGRPSNQHSRISRVPAA